MVSEQRRVSWQLSAGEWCDLLSNVLIFLRLRTAAVEAESCSAAAETGWMWRLSLNDGGFSVELSAVRNTSRGQRSNRTVGL